MGKKTPLYDNHLAAGAKIVDFAGWDMPLHYGSQIQEHHTVRQDAGIFDVSHMTIVDVMGTDATIYLQKILANNINILPINKALYTCMLNEQGNIIDDLIVYKTGTNAYRLIVNSATREKDLAWLNKHATNSSVEVVEQSHLAMIALQGPNSSNKITTVFNKEAASKILALKSFECITIASYFIGRTGYTGEDGFEIILPATEASTFWEKIISATATPCGLGARDTLRLEAGLNLYGTDMDEQVSPLESNLAWTIGWEPQNREFIGRVALEKHLHEGIKNKLVGLVLEGPGVLRNHQRIIVEQIGEGEITSGSFSPTLNKGIALARVPFETSEQCLVEIRGKSIPAKVIKPPFVRHGKKTF
jgi:aminomethyltransferase